MAPPSAVPTPRTTTRSRATPQVPASAPVTRVTRLRAAKESAASTPTTSALPKPAATGLLAKGKAELRKVSDKLKEKEREREAAREAAKKAAAAAADNTYTQQLQAFLRIRPSPTDAELQSPPYLELQDDRNVVMRQPSDMGRPHLAKAPHVYSFDRVFAPETTQAEFFGTTTLPLVEKLLKGDNGLLFAYGVSNSGKSYSIQGQTPGLEERGAVPRAIDVVFNSINGLESTANLKCQGLADVVLTDKNEGRALDNLPMEPETRIEDSVKVDRNFSYAVFVSYVEVYNEKIFDLLDSVLPTARPLAAIPRTMSTGVGLSSAALGSSMSLAAMANGGGGVLRRQALVLKNDPEGTGKYIAGLNEVRVRTREEALAVFRSGQRARQVFGTMANRESSRSHGVLTLKIVRIHNGAPEDPDSAQVSRLSIVDLAGSERTRNTGTTGDRLKEAGNINKSLMVLGQCLEVLRANQQKMAAPGSMRAKKLAVVPFRHSKLTEIFQSFFVGDGCAVMVVHVNPYDTGFDENSHVMRFSAVAREIQTTAASKTTAFPTLKRQISSQLSAFRNAVTGHHHHPTGQKIKVVVPVMPKTAITPVTVDTKTSSFSRPTASSNSRVSNAPPAATSAPSRGSSVPRPASRPPTRPQTPREIDEIFEVVEEEIEVIEEDAEEEEDDDHDYLVDYLFEQLKELKEALYESEMRNAAIEVEIREECALDMQETIKRLNTAFNERLKLQAAHGEEKADMKLDILQRTLDASEDCDTSFDESFITDEAGNSTMSVESALNDDDPFAPTPPGKKQQHEDKPGLLHVERAEPTVADAVEDVSMAETEDAFTADEETASESDGEVTEGVSGVHEGDLTGDVSGDFEGDEEEGEEEEDEEEEIEARATRQSMSVDGEQDEEDEASEEDDGSEEEEEEEEEEDDEDEEGEEIEDSSFADSSFAEGSIISISSDEPSPPRRMSHKTISPNKRTVGTPARTPKVSKASVLAESKRQDSGPIEIPMSDSDDDEAGLVKPATPATKTKKRTLGKRIVTEDEIEASDNKPVGGANVRRMVRGV